MWGYRHTVPIALDGGWWPASCPEQGMKIATGQNGGLAPELVGCHIENNFCPCQGSNPNSLFIQPIA
jgi:hypothetical protein